MVCIEVFGVEVAGVSTSGINGELCDITLDKGLFQTFLSLTVGTET